MDQDDTWHGGRPQPRRLCVRKAQALTPKGAEPHPIFGPRLLWPSGCMDQDATWYGGRPRPARHCVRCGPSYPTEKGHTHPMQFLAHVMTTPLGAEVDLGPVPIVLDGVPAPAKGAQQPPLFGPCLLWPRSPMSATAELVLFGSVRQIKLAVRQLLDARKYNVSYCVVSYVSF